MMPPRRHRRRIPRDPTDVATGRLAGIIALGALVAAASCAEGERPSIGIATNAAFADAAGLAVADAEAEWGELPAEIVVEIESYTRAAFAIEGAAALAARGVDAVVGYSSSAASLASAPVYNEQEIVQLSPQSSASAYSEAGPYSFRLVPPDDRQGAFLAQALRRMPAVSRVVVLYVNDDYGRGLHSTLLRELATAGPEVVGEAPHLERSTNREDEIDLARRVIARAQPDAIVWLGRSLLLGQYLPMLRGFGDMPVIGSDGLAGASADSVTSLWDDVWYVDFVDPAATEAMRAFGRRHLERFGEAAGSAHILTYDATRLLLQAAHDGARTGPQIRAWLESLGRSRPIYQGLSGPIQFDENGDVEREYVLRAVTAAAPEGTGP